MVTIKKTKMGLKIYLDSFPTNEELIGLNNYGTFYIKETRTYKALIHVQNPDKITKRVEFECPINQWFYI